MGAYARTRRPFALRLSVAAADSRAERNAGADLPLSFLSFVFVFAFAFALPSPSPPSQIHFLCPPLCCRAARRRGTDGALPKSRAARLCKLLSLGQRLVCATNTHRHTHIHYTRGIATLEQPTATATITKAIDLSPDIDFFCYTSCAERAAVLCCSRQPRWFRTPLPRSDEIIKEERV